MSIIILLVLGLSLSLPDSEGKSFAAAPFDIVINEIMARPVPSFGLPEAEYIELFNRSEKPVNIDQWSVTVGTRTMVLPYHTIDPGGFLIVTHEKNAVELGEFGNVAGLPTFPVLAMGGQTIVLRNNNQNVISAVRYSDKWYGSNLKASGGWSLELIDPFNPCSGKDNWTASNDSRGGTPGMVNSVKGSNPDKSNPELVRAGLAYGGNLRLHFSKPMHPLSGWSPSAYIAEGPGEPLWVIPNEPLFESADLHFNHKFEEGIYYTITIKGSLFDCAGNFLDINSAETKFTLPQLPSAGNIIINEILFNPFPGGVDFVEIVNISDRTFDLKQLILAGMKNGTPDPAYIITPESYLLFPGKYSVLTTDPETVRMHYHAPDIHSFIMMERLPQMNNESGHVAITGPGMEIIDDVEYSSDMHSPLLADRKGVSLERINYHRPAGDRTNWLSASSTSGFATPGYRNSQFSEHVNEQKKILAVDPKIFSPDNSGYNDVANISYKLERPGYIGTITIFDSRGRKVRKLVRNEIMGTSGAYSWDGRNEANRQSRLGIYLILIELFHPDGEVIKYKESVVLGGRLRESSR